MAKMYNYKTGSYQMNFGFYDSSFEANTNPSSWNDTKAAKIINTQSKRRSNSALIDKLKSVEPGMSKKSGAVLILW